jgi:hypothetical protein
MSFEISERVEMGEKLFLLRKIDWKLEEKGLEVEV